MIAIRSHDTLPANQHLPGSGEEMEHKGGQRYVNDTCIIAVALAKGASQTRYNGLKTQYILWLWA